jgi:HD superfamily phosphodiesterase
VEAFIVKREKVLVEMKDIIKDMPFGIEHTLKVLHNAEEIMEGQIVGPKEKEVITLTAILHDIGAVEAKRKYGSIDAQYQEKEGPIIARKILEKAGCDSRNIAS